MGKIGVSELLIVLVIALIVFGPSRLPALGKMAGKTIGQLKGYVGKMTEELDDIEQDIKNPMSKEDQ